MARSALRQALGAAGALIITRVVGAVIFQPQPTTGLTLLVGTQTTDALTYAAVAATLVIVAMVACLMPARRAASVSPLVALRAQ